MQYNYMRGYVFLKNIVALRKYVFNLMYKLSYTRTAISLESNTWVLLCYLHTRIYTVGSPTTLRSYKNGGASDVPF